MNTKEELEYYNRVYASSEEYRKNPLDSRYINIWKDILRLTDESNETIIEIGCGSGQLARLLLDNGRNYIAGFDYSENAIKIAKDLNTQYSNLFSVKDIYKIKYNELKADTIICTEVLEHLEDDLFVIDVIPSGTRFIFSVPDFWYKSHKRIFKNILDIKTRYAGLEINNFYVHKTPANNTIFLVDSVIR